MGLIQLLPDEVINKIAAGEVVERPASILKELIENSLDAGAQEIDVEIAEGGKELIVVSDDGIGMEHQDAELALMRHATSKIRSESDLYNIETMGFRGEALASIASVSKLTMTTATDESPAINISIDEKGKINSLPAVRTRGTTVICQDLFFNTPARQKFLKAAAYETAHCVDIMQSFALSHPKVSFRLCQGKKSLLECHAVLSADDLGEENTLRRRCEQIFGAEIADRLIYITKQNEYGTLRGLVSPPGIEKSTPRHVYTFLNGRIVRDKVLRIGVQRGYHSHLLKGRYPFVILHLQSGMSLVDVNVHPSKIEVRFQYPAEVQGLVAVAIREGIRSGSWAQSFPTSMHSHLATLPTDRSEKISNSFPAKSLPRIQIQSFFSSQANQESHPSQMKNTKDGTNDNNDKMPQPTQPLFDEFAKEDGYSTVNPTRLQWENLTYLGSVAKCFLLFSDADRLMIVDQHAFHERILYEQFRNTTFAKSMQSQSLLIPETFQFSAMEINLLREHQCALKALGFNFSFLSNLYFELTAVPHLLESASFDRLLKDIMSVLEKEGSSASLQEELYHMLFATMACHGAVRAGDELSGDQLKSLIASASEVDFAQNCPHGRPVFIWFSKEHMGRWFER